jgi:TetR/AcrR family transcriptional regulator
MVESTTRHEEARMSQQRIATPLPRKVGRPPAGAEDLPSERHIIDRGLAAFAELGYDGTTVRELARRLGVSHNFINDRYGSKASFWTFVVDGAQSSMRQALTDVLATDYDDDLEQLRDVVRTFHRMSLSEPNLARIIQYEATQGGDRLQHVISRHLAPVRDAVAPLVARLIAEGRVRPIPLDTMVFAVVAMTQVNSAAPLIRLLGDSFADNPTGYVETLSDILINGFELPGAALAR